MRLTRLAIQNFQFTSIIFMAFVVLGLGAIATMPTSEDPPLEPPEAKIFAFSPGTSPIDLERLIEPLEEAIDEIEDIEHFYVYIENGAVEMNVIFHPWVDGDEKYSEVREKVNRRNELSQDLQEIEVAQDLLDIEATRWSTSNINIFQFALVSETHSYRDLYEEARWIERRFERVEGVLKVEIHGYPAEVVRVDADLDRLATHGVRLDQVVEAIRSHNANLPAGNLDIGRRRFNVRTSGPYTSLRDIGETVIAAREAQFLLLKDVAQVRFGYEDEVYRARYNGTRCLFITVQQNKNAKISWIAETIKSGLPQVRARLPAGMDLILAFDQSIGVADRLNTFFSSLGQGVLVVGLLIFLVVGLRPSLVVMAALPLSFLIGIGCVYLTGYGLHQMTIMGLIVALGLLVDNAIVVTESVHRFQERGMNILRAAVEGTQEVTWPTVSSTLTTVLAFLPIVMMEDETGDFIRSMPVTVIYTLMASMLVALTFTPLLSSKLLKGRLKESGLQALLRRWIDGAYRPLLSRGLAHCGRTLFFATAVFLSSLALFPLVGITFFPKAEKPQFLVDIKLPRGSSLDATDSVARYVEDLLLEQPEVSAVLANVGNANPQIHYSMLIRRNKPYFAQLLVLVDEDKGRRVEQIVEDLRRRLADFPGGQIEAREFQQGPPMDAPIVVKILGDDLKILSDLASQVETMLVETPGAIYVDNQLKVAKTDLSVRVDREKAYRHGLTPIAVDRTVWAAVTGLVASTYRDREGKRYDILVGLPVDEAPALEDFDHIFLTSLSGAQVPLREVASIEFSKGYSVVDHYNLERAAYVRADVSGRSAETVEGDLVRKLDAYPWPPGYRYTLGGELESRSESFGSMAQAMVIALVCIYAVLVLQFRSFLQPLIIFSAIPFAVVGSILALLLTGNAFSFTAFIGLTSLVGIVINDSILLVDYVNLKRGQGLTPSDALLEAGATRFTPVILTTVTTIGGLLPLTLQGGTLWAPMGWTIIGGLITSTALTLLVVPALYLLFARGDRGSDGG